MRLEALPWLHALWALPLLALLLAYAEQERRRAAERLIAAGLLPLLTRGRSSPRRRSKEAILVVALGLLIIALARPAWNLIPSEERRLGRDIVFLIDVSRSMLADDLPPSRLGRARLAIGDLAASLRGDRVALIAYAGTAVIKCPLTTDTSFLRFALEDIRPETVSRGGSLIGDAIRKALHEVFEPGLKGAQDLILISDGGDQESFPLEAAKEAGERGVRIIAIGLGDEREGRRIPITDAQGRRDYLRHEGREVWTKLEPEVLRQVALATPGGRYLNVGTGHLALDEVYRDLIRDAERRELEAQREQRYDEKFGIFLGLALLLLIIEVFIHERS